MAIWHISALLAAVTFEPYIHAGFEVTVGRTKTSEFNVSSKFPHAFRAVYSLVNSRF